MDPEHNNSFYDARAANIATQEHVCTDRCPIDSKGVCRVQAELWAAQHRAALRWNQPESERSTSISGDSRGRLADSSANRIEPGRGYL